MSTAIIITGSCSAAFMPGNILFLKKYLDIVCYFSPRGKFFLPMKGVSKLCKVYDIRNIHNRHSHYLVMPCTFNWINSIDSEFSSSEQKLLLNKGKKLTLVPQMNKKFWDKKQTQSSIRRLKSKNINILPPLFMKVNNLHNGGERSDFPPLKIIINSVINYEE